MSVSQGRPPLRAQAARWVRRLSGEEATASNVATLVGRVAALEAQMEALQRGRYPHGPVYLGDNQALVATRWGAKMVVDTRDSLLSPWLLLDGLWESHVTGWFTDTLKPGQTFVDVGANIGYFTLLGAHLVGPDGRVGAVEAHGGLFDILRRNVVINGFRDRVTLWQRAAWSESARLQFHQRDRYQANSSLGAVGEAGLSLLGDTETVVEVEAVALDEILGDFGPVDVLKVDVEGAEVHAFKGLSKTLEANEAITVIFEWSPEQLAQIGSDPADLVATLTGHGFALRLMEEGLAPIEPGRLLDLPYGNVVAVRPQPS